MSEDLREVFTCEGDECLCPSCVQARADHRAIVRELAAGLDAGAARDRAPGSVSAGQLQPGTAPAPSAALEPLLALAEIVASLEAWAFRSRVRAQQDYARNRETQGAEALEWYHRAGLFDGIASKAEDAAGRLREALRALQAREALALPAWHALEADQGAQERPRP